MTYIEMCRCGDRLNANQVCPACRKYHHHGMVHTTDGELIYLCSHCTSHEKKMWDESRSRARS